jgi:hypothetical protein
MRYDLRTLARRASNPRRKSITFRDIVPPAVLATDLYQAGYKPVIAIWATHAEHLAAEYERTLSALITDAPADMRARLDEAEAEPVPDPAAAAVAMGVPDRALAAGQVAWCRARRVQGRSLHDAGPRGRARDA